VKRLSPAAPLSIAAAFLAGFLTYLLYLRWSAPLLNPAPAARGKAHDTSQTPEPPSYPVRFVAPEAEARREAPVDLPVLQAREVEKIRGLVGTRARIRGRIFRVGHSAKSNTYFLNFGPTREALTGVIFASAVELFEKSKLPPKAFEGKEVEIQGEIKDHPQYGLELILEDPSQIKVVD
jgi:hypothetical protein